jgi:hypothetical protein
MKQEISMKVNQENLVKGLKYSFTNKTTVLGELMQNARRAGARSVMFDFDHEKRTLLVTDDGCGIDSMETLLTVAESGWDEDTVTTEHPFGIGFLSALFACEYLDITSKGGSLSVITEDVLSFTPVSVSAVPVWNGMTEIKLSGLDLEQLGIEEALKKLAIGFSIPVIFNGEELEKNLAINSGLQFIETEIGSIYLIGLDKPTDYNTAFKVFLQGMPIYQTNSWLNGSNHHVIHLDSSIFYARLPDREKLIDEKETIARITEVLTATIEQQLVLMKSSLSAEAFVSFYSIMKSWNLIKLLNDVPLVPKQVLYEIQEYPNCCTDAYGSFEWAVNKPLLRDEIEARGIVSLREDIQESGAAHYLFAWKKDHLIYKGCLDADHWLNALVVPFDIDDDLTIEIINKSQQSFFKGSWAWLNVCFCDSYKIHIGDEFVEISDTPMFTGNEGTEMGIIPKGDSSGNGVLTQAFSFRNEYDEFQGSCFESDTAKFISFVVANTSKDRAEAMKCLLPSFENCPSLYEDTFIIKIDGAGKVESVLLDPPY